MAVCGKSKAVKTQTTLAAFFASVGQEKNFSKITGFFPHPNSNCAMVQHPNLALWFLQSSDFDYFLWDFSGFEPATSSSPIL